MTLPRSFVLLLTGGALGLALVACDKDPAAAAPSPSASVAVTSASAAAAASAAARAARSPRHALIFADPGGTTPVDSELRRAQQWVEKLDHSTDKLIELGRLWVVKARHASDPGFYLNAKACGDQALELDPDNWLARELLAQVALNQHRFKEARDLCREVLGRYPEAVITHGVLSDVSLELGDHDGAIKAADKMVDLKPNLASYTRVSYLQWLRGDRDAAVKSAKLAIESSSSTAEPEPRAFALVQTAYFFWHRGDYEGAEAGFRKALSEFTNYPPALIGKGRTAMARGSAGEAVELLEAAFKANPTVDAAWRLGDARLLAGNAAGSDEAYAHVVKEGRRSDKRTLAQFYATKNRDTDEAVKLGREEWASRPGLYTADALAWALYRKGEFAEARTLSDQACSLGTKDAIFLYHAGAIRIAAGDVAAGKKLVAEALALEPKFDPFAADEARKLIAADAAPATTAKP